MRTWLPVVFCLIFVLSGCRGRSSPPEGTVEEKPAFPLRLAELERKEQLAAFYDDNQKVLYVSDRARFGRLLEEQEVQGLAVRQLDNGSARVTASWDGAVVENVVAMAPLSFPDLTDMYFEAGDYRLWWHGQQEFSQSQRRGGCRNLWWLPIPPSESEAHVVHSSRTHTRAHKYLDGDGPIIKWERLWAVDVQARFGHRVPDCRGTPTLTNQNERWLTDIHPWTGPY